jgi:hypothetical protein
MDGSEHVLEVLARVENASDVSAVSTEIGALRALADDDPLELYRRARERAIDEFERLTARAAAEKAVPSADDPEYQLAIERWAVVGTALLRPELAHLALEYYETLLHCVRVSQNQLGVRLHKGTPYFHIASALLLRDQARDADDYLTLAAFEDGMTAPQIWNTAPAARQLHRSFGGPGLLDRVTRLLAIITEKTEWLEMANPELLLLRLLPEHDLHSAEVTE